MVDESASYVILKVMVNGFRASPISVIVKIFVSTEFQPKAGTYVANIITKLCTYIVNTCMYLTSCIVSHFLVYRTFICLCY